MALTGDGGDECFGGYDRYRAALLMQKLERYLPRSLRETVGSAAGLLPHKRAKSTFNRVQRLLETASLEASERYLRWLGVFTPGQLMDGYRAEMVEEFRVYPGEGNFEPEKLYERPRGDAAQRAAFVDFHTYLPGDLLTKVDRASMAHGLECRAPFLDHALVEFALSLPTKWKIHGGRGKRILREWAAGLLPPAILKRPKMGFGVPVGEWFRGPLLPRLRDALLAGDSICQRLFQPDWLKRLLDEHVESRVNHEHRLWALLMLDLWARRWKPVL